MDNQQPAERQAKEFLYDLQNKANENGFKPTEKWKLNLMTLAEKKLIENNFHAAVTTKGSPEVLAVLLAHVQAGLKQTTEANPELKDIKQQQWQYLVAYNPEREKR